MKQSSYKKMTIQEVKRLRKEFLDLTRAISKARDYRESNQLRKNLRRWKDHFNAYVKGFRDYLDNAGQVREGQRIERQGEKLSHLIIALRLWRTQEDFLYREQERDRWFRDIRKAAIPLWKEMEKALEVIGAEPVIHIKDIHQTDIAGFRILVEGVDKDVTFLRRDNWNERIATLTRSLKEYRKKATAVMPKLISSQVPIKLSTKYMKDAIAMYHFSEKMITVFIESIKPGNLLDTVRVLAHEQGHHIYKTYLSGAQKEMWGKVVDGGQSTLDLNQLLSLWPEDMASYEFEDKLKGSHPELYIQYRSLEYDPRYEIEIYRRSGLEKLMEVQDDGTLPVYTGLPTAYSSFSAEEAFCEVVGVLVAYGPRAVPDVAVHWITEMLGGDIKVGSSSRDIRIASVVMGKVMSIRRNLTLQEQVKGSSSLEIGVYIDRQGKKLINYDPMEQPSSWDFGQVGKILVAKEDKRLYKPDCLESIEVVEGKLGKEVDVWRVAQVELHPELRGLGLGSELYVRATELVSKRGGVLVPDKCMIGGTTSSDALRVWNSSTVRSQVNVEGEVLWI